MQSRTIPAPQSVDAHLEPAELVREVDYPAACIAASTRRSEKQTVREMPAVRWDRRCTPPPTGLSLGTYMHVLSAIERTR